MPVTFKVASHSANSRPPESHPCKSATDLLNRTWGQSVEKRVSPAQVLQSSLQLERDELERVVPEQNGLVHTILTAYNTHKHLVLRPDDVWTAMIGQFNFYVNAHAEELRKQFVAHEGKKTLEVRAVGTRFSVDFGSMAEQMTGLIHKNVVDEELKDWILPDFSTTTYNDTVVCAVLMMATLKAYFKYVFTLECGIPSITLEGKKADWEKILKRIDKLDSFGKEPKGWAKLLQPILEHFVAAFDYKGDNDNGVKVDLDFWGKICDYRRGGSGPDYMSGWITAFCVWSSEGKWIGPPLSPSERAQAWRPMLELDGVQYTTVDITDVPPAFCEVDVLLDDNGVKFDCMMVSGLVGTSVLDSNEQNRELQKEERRESEGERDKVAPFAAWFMFVKDTTELQPEDYERARIEEKEEEPGIRKSNPAMASGGKADGSEGKVGSKIVKALKDSKLGRRLSRLSSSKS